ncbi:ABC transporter permease [Ruania halotolerans]|uniref:ABC transporter permease n=1 Tax=Ruania halotolerans TaxID=2897773 RepID=UPI001E3B90EA|nr:ABC transporter permease [Ruania halotolerans]UFU04882.1 ABC transporter permease [Ruania halotolerans]
MATKAAFALVKKDLTVTLRAPLFAAISILVPVAFTLLYAIVIHVSTTAPIAIADEDATPRSAEFVQVMEQMRNGDGPYYEILTTDPDRAREMYRDGDAGAMLTIPQGFAHSSDTGDSPAVTLSLININADGTKNHHLRIEEALRQFEQALPTTPASQLTITETTAFDHDIPVTIYLGSALIVFAALYAGIVNVGVGIAREWEGRTAKGLVLSPSGPAALVVGKWIAGAATSLVTIAVTVVGIGWVLGYPVNLLGWASVGVLAIVWIYGAALGTLLGVALRQSLPLIPIAVMIAITHFLVNGYESYIRGFAHGGAVDLLWSATHGIPLAPLFDMVRFEVASLPQPDGATVGVIGSLLLATAVLALAAWRLTRALRFSQGQ